MEAICRAAHLRVAETLAVGQRELDRLLGEFQSNHWGLNFGAGATRFHDRILNLDIGRGPATDIIMAGRELPFRENVFDLVISQEVLEHVDDPWHWIGELHRVLKPGGRFYCQVPFIIGYHPGPTDFWRFTREAFPQLFPSDAWDIEKLELAPRPWLGLVQDSGGIPGGHCQYNTSSPVHAHEAFPPCSAPVAAV